MSLVSGSGETHLGGHGDEVLELAYFHTAIYQRPRWKKSITTVGRDGLRLLQWVSCKSDRNDWFGRAPTEKGAAVKNKNAIRKNIGFVVVVSGALATATLGLAGPAAATTGSGFHHHHSHHHHSRVHDMRPSVNGSQADTAVHSDTVVCTTGAGCAAASRR